MQTSSLSQNPLYNRDRNLETQKPVEGKKDLEFPQPPLQMNPSEQGHAKK